MSGVGENQLISIVPDELKFLCKHIMVFTLENVKEIDSFGWMLMRIYIYIYIYIWYIVSVELEKQSYCDLKVANKTEDYVAFKVFPHPYPPKLHLFSVIKFL